MPIVVQHQPSFVGVGQTAFRAGYGQFQQQQFQNSMAVMQMALQERARQQALANQQQAAYLGAQQEAADRQSRERMFALQQSNQAAMNDADNRSRMQMELWQGQQQSQNYADLRDHQTQLAQFKAATSAAEYDKKSRMEALGGVASGLTTKGQQLATKMRTELGIITSQRAAGQVNDEQYQSALAAWDERFGAEGDWSQHRTDPAAQAKSALESSRVTDPFFGPGRVFINKDGTTDFRPDFPKTWTDENGDTWQSVPTERSQEITLVPKPKPEKEKPVPPAVTAKDVIARAKDMASEAPQIPGQPDPSWLDFIDKAQQEADIANAKLGGAGGGEGEAASAGQPAQSGVAPPQQPQDQQQAMEIGEAPPSVQGEQERFEWQRMATLPRSKPHLTQDAKDIQILLSQGLKITDPQVTAKITALAAKINDEANKKGIAPKQPQQKASMMDVPAELEKLGLDYDSVSAYMQDVTPAGTGWTSKFEKALESGTMTPAQIASQLEEIVSKDPKGYIESRKKMGLQ